MEQNAWKVVYDELMKVGLFRGNYDAKHASEHFMYGIEMVMENIAANISEECLIMFQDVFTTNMIGSQGVKNDS